MMGSVFRHSRHFQSTWIDSFHNGTAIMFSEGRKGNDSFTILGSYAYTTPEMEQHWAGVQKLK